MKKNNDFDYIKDKIDSSLDAPDSVNEAFVLRALEGSEEKEKSNIIPLKKKKKPRALPTIAAAVAVVLIAAVGIGVVPRIPKNNVIAPTAGDANDTLSAYTDYKEVKKDIKRLRQSEFRLEDFFVIGVKNEKLAQPNFESSDSAVAGMGDSSFGKTFTQVEGVDEDDIIKTDGKYIYYGWYDYAEDANVETYEDFERYTEEAANEDEAYSDEGGICVYIFKAAEKDSKLAAKIPINFGDYSQISGLYVQGNRLVVLCDTEEKTAALIYDISDMANIKKTAEFAQSGNFSASRLIGNKLYLVSNQWTEKELPYVCCAEEKQNIPANQIYKTANPTAPEFLVISQIDIRSADKIEQSKAVFGGSSKVYCNKEHMYVLSDITNYGVGDDWHYTSQLIQIDISGGIRFSAAAKLNGYAKNQYAMDEYGGVFRIAVTDTASDGANVNRLYTLDKNLKQLGEVEDFAKGEHIEAVKFIGNTAYVITFRNTDPLFVIDLSDARAPKILGAVKIDGFSTTLIPIGENQVLGIGTDASNSDTDSLKLALFDITDKAAPKVLDEKVYKNITSFAMSDSKQILVNPEKGNYTVCMEERTDDKQSYSVDDYYPLGYVYGTLTFRASGNRIVTEQKFVSEKIKSSNARCTYIGDTIYIVDENARIDCTKY